MKISVNDKKLFALSEMQCKVICNDISEDLFEEDMKRRLQYILIHKYEQCFKRLKDEWGPKLAQRMDSIPTDADKLAEIIFSQEDYQSRKQREEAAKIGE